MNTNIIIVQQHYIGSYPEKLISAKSLALVN